MKRVEQQYDIRIKRQELKNAKYTNKAIEQGFNELEEKQTSETSIKTFVTKLIRESNPADNAGAHEEIKKAVVDAIEDIIELVENGTTINVYLPAEAKATLEEEVVHDPSEFTLGIANSYRKLNLKQNELGLLSDGDDSEDNINDENR